MEALARLVRVFSPSGLEGELADLVSADLGALGFRVSRAGHNLYFQAVPGDGPALLLNSHLDTVPACAGWQRPPLEATVEGERLYGLGANDAKGCVTAILEAAVRLRAAHAAGARVGPVWVALSAMEETGGVGLGEVVPLLPPLGAALVGEPTGCRPVVAQKGLLVLRGSATGVAGHAAHGGRDGARNAVHAAARDVARLAELGESEAGALGAPHPLLGPVTLQVTMIQGGHARNAVPDQCEFWVDVRTNPDTDPGALAAQLGTGLESGLALHSQRLRAVETAPGEAVVRAAVEVTGCPGEGSRTTSDWVNLAGVPTVKIGPGDTARSHRADEYVTAAELELGASVYERIALRLGRMAAEVGNP
jgi:acetylornithine deacetylase